MAVADWLAALEQSRVGEQMRESWFPYVEGIHVLALALSVGTIVWFDLRLVGLAMRARPASEIYQGLKAWMVTGFTIMFVTGALLFVAHATKAYESPVFRAKAALLLLAGVNMLVFHLTIDRRRAEWNEMPVPPVAARAAGLLSLVLWLSVIAAGRMLAYDL